MLTDSHAHLDDREFAGELPQVIKRAQQAGLELIVAPGTDLDSSNNCAQIARQYPMIYAAAGFHPHSALEFSEDKLPELEALLQEEKVIAAGEIGLDYHYDFSPPQVQQEVFLAQLELASKNKLPVIAHLRKADEDFYRIVKSVSLGDKPGVVHCFSSDLKMAKNMLDLGFYLGITGVLTFNKAEVLREVARYAPLDRLLLETDCPYLAPHPHRGKRNEPANIPLIAGALASLKHLNPQEVAEVCRDNLRDLFGI